MLYKYIHKYIYLLGMRNFLKRRKLFILFVVVLVVGAFFIFDEVDERSLFYKTPPKDPEEIVQWLSENVDNNDHDVFIKLDYKVPSWEELDRINESLPSKHNYPGYIKAVQTYGTLPNLIEVLYFGDVLKDLGVNTQFIHANYRFKEDGFKFWYLGYDRPKDLSQDESKRALVHNILLAKQQGLAVILFPDYVQLEDGGMSELGISSDLEDRLETIALELAQIAEKYNVEYLVPSNQIEMILSSNGYSVSETHSRTNAYYARVVPKIREIYSGKVFYKMGGFNRWENYDGISLEGADLFGFTSCHTTPELEFIDWDMQALAQQANKLSEKYGVPWINAEFVISNAADQMNMFGEVRTDYPIEVNYKAGLDAFEKYGENAVGFTVHSLLGAGKVYDTKAFPLIKEFFSSKN